MIDTKKTIKHIVSWLKEYIKKSQSNGFIIGISGGIDSSVTSVLVAMTTHPTITLEMPILEKKKNFLSQKHINFLKSKFINVHSLKRDLSCLLNNFCTVVNTDDNNVTTITEIKKNKNLALANIKSRLRMMTLYYYANIKNYLVVGTGNKIEDFGVGFFTKYGDGGVDLHPIADLTKSEIRSIAKELNILDCIQNAIPTDGLWDDQRSDEEQLKASYEELEWAMKMSEKKLKRISSFKERKYEIMKIYQTLHKKNIHKMIPIPVCKIPRN
ncbi:NAD(+) synthase [Blattabacterium cuenoti]|uniref:NAD(+) synthase n=1 Tax=Blattabacterium cuenoti TaxID=1653831 RepID=UPI00163B763E|nr:NAD(+) synthase [Blattabacterium cuenoti]